MRSRDGINIFVLLHRPFCEGTKDYLSARFAVAVTGHKLFMRCTWSRAQLQTVFYLIVEPIFSFENVKKRLQHAFVIHNCVDPTMICSAQCVHS